jgi:adenylate cyclase
VYFGWPHFLLNDLTRFPVEKPENYSYFLWRTIKGDKKIPLMDRSYWTIGRNQENDIVIHDHTISRNHALLQATEAGGFLLIDLGSRNGTFVNGRRVGIPVTLQNQDEVTFGKVEVEFHALLGSQNSNPSKFLERETQTSVLHERRLMSVMVADMRNFTGLSRQLDENILSALIGNWFREAGQILRQAGSWVDKYIGDAVMALWFHGEEEVTVEEILRILEAISSLNRMTQKLASQYPLPFPLQIGVGLNTGYAMVGNTGSGDHPDYTAIGDTVNATFRLESATKILGFDIAVGQKTYGYLENFNSLDQYFTEYQAELKGYEESITTYGLTFEQLLQFIQLNQTMKTLS